MTTPDAGAADCPSPPGVLAPRVDRNKCEGKADCARVCPYDVFAIETLGKAARTGLSLVGRLKGMAHGWKQAIVVNPDACHGCGLCVSACPEKAIVLRRVGA